MNERLTATDLEALHGQCATQSARIEKTRAFINSIDRCLEASLQPEALLMLSDDLSDPNFLARPVLLRWHNLTRERNGLED